MFRKPMGPPVWYIIVRMPQAADDPYRTSEPRHLEVPFGNRRRAIRQIVAGAALVAASLATVFAWSQLGGRIWGSVLAPALYGLFLFGRARWGTLELDSDTRTLIVRRRGVWPRTKVSVPLADVGTVQVVPSSFREEKPDYDLVLARQDQTTVLLRRAASEAELEDDRARVADFMREHGLLWGGSGADDAIDATRRELLELKQRVAERVRVGTFRKNATRGPE